MEVHTDPSATSIFGPGKSARRENCTSMEIQIPRHCLSKGFIVLGTDCIAAESLDFWPAVFVVPVFTRCAMLDVLTLGVT
jgi:hypothetical protein